MYLTCGGQGGHVDPVRRYGRSRGPGVGVLGLLVHVQAHVVAVFLGTDWTGEVLPHWVQWVHTIAIGCHQRRTKMQLIKSGVIILPEHKHSQDNSWIGRKDTGGNTCHIKMHLTDLGNTMALECFVLLCMYKPPAEVYTCNIKTSQVCKRCI